MMTEHVPTVRRFNRLVTQRVGALDDHFLGGKRPLGASRVLFEIGRDGVDLRDLRSRLGLDAGYLSRLVQSLAADGLVVVRAGTEDGRVRRAELTEAGLAEMSDMNHRADRVAEGLLEPLTDSQRDRLVRAMAEVERLLRAGAVTIEQVDPASRAARWCVAQYFEELARVFDNGFDPARSLPADDDDMRPPHGSFLVAVTGGEVVAGGAVKTIEPGVASLKRMWVAHSVRGLGLGRRMLVALEATARELGLTTVRLETNRALTDAVQMYRTSGYAEVAPFNADPYAHHWFEKKL